MKDIVKTTTAAEVVDWLGDVFSFYWLDIRARRETLRMHSSLFPPA